MLRKRQKNDLYTHFLIAAQRNFTVTELSDRLKHMPAHDSITKWLETDKLTPSRLWKAMDKEVDKNSGDLIIDDTVFDHFYGKGIDLVYRQYSGVHHKPVSGIGLTTLLWFSNYHVLPTDYRIYDPQTDGKDKHDHASEMLKTARARGLSPAFVIMDAWYASLETLKLIDRVLSWKFVSWLQHNRKVHFYHTTPDSKLKSHSISNLPIPEEGTLVWLPGFGKVKIFKVVKDKPQDIDYLVTNDTSLSRSDILDVAARRWEVENYHRALKQTVGAAKCQSRLGRSQRNHLFCAVRAFLSLEAERFKTHLSYYELKAHVINEAITLYLSDPTVTLLKL